jgi:hypothetical protein
MFSVMFAGAAGATGPDMAKAQGGIDRVFAIIDTPSKIDAIKDDQDAAK